MAQNLTLNYDKVGDILYIDHVKPYAEQVSDEIGDEGIVARFNPITGKIENLEIMFFTSQLMSDGRVELPVTSDMSLAE